MKNIFSVKSKIIFVSLFTATVLILNYDSLRASDKKDLILILDTSYSMSGNAPGSKNILPQVKKSLPQFIDKMEKGDSVTLITFDSDIKILPTVYIGDKKNKESLINYINDIQARGMWTYTSQMMKEAFKKAQELEQKDKDRKQVIVILTDTIDDPPPVKKGDKLNVKDLASNYKDKEWFIFFINFGQSIKTNQKFVKLQNDLKTSVTKYAKVIETTPLAEGNKKITDKTAKISQKNIDIGIKKTVEKDLAENISKMDKEVAIDKGWSFSYIILIIVLIIIGIIIAVIYYFSKYSSAKVKGKLEYWDHTMITPYYENYDLTKQNLKEILIGPKTSHNLTIRDFEIADPLIITSVKAGNESKSSLYAGKGCTIEYVNREQSGFLENGDIFKIANYTFKYSA